MQGFVDVLPDLQAVGVIVPDQTVGCVQDGLRGSIVGVDDHTLRLGIDPAEAQDVAEGCAPETEYALVIVPHHGDVVMPGTQQFKQLELDVIGILELVHQDVLVFFLILLQD